MSTRIYLEGGGDSKFLRIRCQEGFHKLLKKQTEFEGRKPRFVACGSRGDAFDRFETAHLNSKGNDFVAMLIDSEDTVDNINRTWKHLKTCDKWNKPQGATDKQVLLMTTCMETWIVADRTILKSHYLRLIEGRLPPLSNLENRNRHDIQDKLENATQDCTNAYEKGKRSFVILGKLNPTALKRNLPSFKRMIRILEEKL